VVVGIEQVVDFDDALALTGAHDRAAKLGTALEGAGYEKVTVLTGAGATREAIQSALEESIEATAPGGTVVWVFEGHGIGGDYGDAHLLAADGRVDALATTGFDVARLPADLFRMLDTRSLLVVTDAVHAGDHQGTALIGPVATDWYSSGTNFGVLSAVGTGQTAIPGLFVEGLTEAVLGAGDGDGDGSTTTGELITFLRNQVGNKSGGRMHPARAGKMEDHYPLFTSLALAKPATNEVADPSAGRSTASSSSMLRTVSWGTMIAGTVSGATSIGLYAAKRSECVSGDVGLICGDSEAYTGYKNLQHITGWVGGGLLLTGVGLYVLDAGALKIGLGAVHWSGRF